MMLRCPELRRLPKSVRFSSILWRHQSPGSVTAFLAAGSSSGFLDPSHPAALRKVRFPQYQGKDIQIKIFPVALLRHPPTVIYPFRRPFLKWGDRVTKMQEAGITAIEVKGEAKLFLKESGQPVGPEQLYLEDEQEMVRRARLPECRATPKGPLLKVAAAKARQRVPMSFFLATSKARMGAKRCTRRIITLRVKAALNLIVTRGAYYGDESKKNSGYVEEIQVRSPTTPSTASGPAWPTMKFDDNEAESMGRNWIVQGWSYIFAPNIEVYRMPYSKLIPILREALTTLKTQAIEMENKWLANSLLHEQRMALKSRSLGSDFPQRVVSKDTVPQPQNSVSKPSTSAPLALRNQARAPRKLRSSFDNTAWKSNLEAEMQLLAQIPKVKR